MLEFADFGTPLKIAQINFCFRSSAQKQKEGHVRDSVFEWDHMRSSFRKPDSDTFWAVQTKTKDCVRAWRWFKVRFPVLGFCSGLVVGWGLSAYKSSLLSLRSKRIVPPVAPLWGGLRWAPFWMGFHPSSFGSSASALLRPRSILVGNSRAVQAFSSCTFVDSHCCMSGRCACEIQSACLSCLHVRTCNLILSLHVLFFGMSVHVLADMSWFVPVLSFEFLKTFVV